MFEDILDKEKICEMMHTNAKITINATRWETYLLRQFGLEHKCTINKVVLVALKLFFDKVRNDLNYEIPEDDPEIVRLRTENKKLKEKNTYYSHRNQYLNRKQKEYYEKLQELKNQKNK